MRFIADASAILATVILLLGLISSYSPLLNTTGGIFETLGKLVVIIIGILAYFVLGISSCLFYWITDKKSGILSIFFGSFHLILIFLIIVDLIFSSIVILVSLMIIIPLILIVIGISKLF